MDGNTGDDCAVDIATRLGLCDLAGNWNIDNPSKDPCQPIRHYILAPADIQIIAKGQ